MGKLSVLILFNFDPSLGDARNILSTSYLEADILSRVSRLPRIAVLPTGIEIHSTSDRYFLMVMIFYLEEGSRLCSST